MAQNNYQEPIEKEDIDPKNKFTGPAEAPAPTPEKNPEKEEILPKAETPEVKEIEPSGLKKETGAEVQEEKIGEKIETVRKTIETQKPVAQASVSDDAGTVSQITEYEKKVEKLVELALQKGPEHAIKVAQHLDKGKSVFEADNYTLDEIHDRLLENELRKQLVQKGLLKEL